MKNLKHVETFVLVLLVVAVSHYLETPTAKSYLAAHQGINDLLNSFILGAVVAARIVFKYKSAVTPTLPVTPAKEPQP